MSSRKRSNQALAWAFRSSSLEISIHEPLVSRFRSDLIRSPLAGVGLPKRFAKRHGGGHCDIERTQAGTDRDDDPRIGGCRDRLGNACTFPPEQQDVRRLIAEIKIWRGALGREEQQTMTGGAAPFLELGPGIVAPPVDLVEVVHPGAAKIPIRYRKTRGLDDMGRHAHAGAKS